MRLSRKLKVYWPALVLFLTVLAAGISPARAAGEAGYEEWLLKTAEDTRKVWEIQFSLPLDPDSVNNDSIYITRGAERLETGFMVDGCTVYAAPLQAYETSREYLLFITDKVTSTSGRQLSIPVMMPFVIVDKNAKIQRISCRYSAGFTLVTVCTTPDVHMVKAGSDEMKFEGGNTFTHLLLDLKPGAMLTIKAYNENNKLLETKKCTV